MLGLVLAACCAAPPTFAAESAAGPTASGPLGELAADWSVTLEPGAAATGPNRVAGADLIALRRPGVPVPPPPDGPHVVFANGDRLPGEVQSIANERVRFRAHLGTHDGRAVARDLTIPQTALVAIWFGPPPDAPDAPALKLMAERRRRDVLLLHNGDTRTGTVAEYGGPGQPFAIRIDGRAAPVDAARIAAVALSTDLARPMRPKGPYARLTLANGARLSLASATTVADAIHGQTTFGEDVQIPLDQLVVLEIRQGKATALSDLKPRRYEHTPYLGVRWPYALDAALDGGPLRIGGSHFDRGVAMHSHGQLTFAPDGAYRRFEATVGLDDRLGVGGSARVYVRLDGKAVGETAAELTAGSGPRAVSVDATGAKELTLVVEFGSGGDVRDRVIWGDARLIR